MNNNYTPGPWHVTTALSGKRAIAQSEDLYSIAIIEQWREESEANARLIAAAPELLEACQEMVKHLEETDFDVCGTPEKFMNKWKAAIAKAEGKKEEAI